MTWSDIIALVVALGGVPFFLYLVGQALQVLKTAAAENIKDQRLQRITNAAFGAAERIYKAAVEIQQANPKMTLKQIAEEMAPAAANKILTDSFKQTVDDLAKKNGVVVPQEQVIDAIDRGIGRMLAGDPTVSVVVGAASDLAQSGGLKVVP